MQRRPANERVQHARNLQSADDVRKFYRDWSAEYDRDIADELKFTGGVEIAELLTERLTLRSSRIIDLGCGTGLVGAELQRLGFTEIDGLDLSPEMLEVARSKNIYRELIEADLLKPLDIAEAAYDAAISAGTFTTGQVHAGRLSEILRVLKPGGMLACVIASDYWRSGGFAGILERLQFNRRIMCVHQSIRPISKSGTAKARFCLFMVQEPSGPPASAR